MGSSAMSASIGPALDVDLVHRPGPSCGVTQGLGVTTASQTDRAIATKGQSLRSASLASRAVPADLADAAAALERIWRAHVRPLVPRRRARRRARAPGRGRVRRLAPRSRRRCSRRWTPAASRAPARSRSSRRPAAATPPPTPRCWRPRRPAAGASCAFCRSEPGERFRGRARAGARRGRARHQAAHEPAGIRLLAPRPRTSPSHSPPSAACRCSSTRAARCRRSRATSRACSSANPGAQVVLAHCAIADLHAVCALRHPNIRFDTSLWNSLDVRALLARGRARAGAVRLRRAVLHARSARRPSSSCSSRRWARAMRSAATPRLAARSACSRASRARS